MKIVVALLLMIAVVAILALAAGPAVAQDGVGADAYTSAGTLPGTGFALMLPAALAIATAGAGALMLRRK